MNKDGCKKVVEGEGDLPASDQAHDLFVKAWAALGRKPDEAKLIKFPLTPGDFSSQIAQIPDDADCFYGQLGEAVWPSILTAAKKLGKEAPGGTARRATWTRRSPPTTRRTPKVPSSWASTPT